MDFFIREIKNIIIKYADLHNCIICDKLADKDNCDFCHDAICRSHLIKVNCCKEVYGSYCPDCYENDLAFSWDIRGSVKIDICENCGKINHSCCNQCFLCS